MKSSLQYGTTTIDFELAYANRKSMGITVMPDLSVQVIAPEGTALEKIHEKLMTKAHWIIKQQDFFLTFHPKTPPRRYISGETHLYLGKQYRLKIIEQKEEYVKLRNGYITVAVADTSDKTNVKQLLNQWYQQKAEKHFANAIQECNNHLTFKNNAVFHYKWMQKHWGICNKNGRITLNYELIKAPKKCIQYVIIHELCHLVHLDHSNAFYTLMEQNCTDWKDRKNYLEKLMV